MIFPVHNLGVDLMDLAGVLMSDQDLEASRRAHRLRNVVEAFQESFTVIEKVRYNVQSHHTIDICLKLTVTLINLKIH